jgi:hypothetical protein
MMLNYSNYQQFTRCEKLPALNYLIIYFCRENKGALFSADNGKVMGSD